MKLRIIFPTIILIILIVMVVLTFQYKPAVRLLPLLIGVPLIVLVGIQLVKELRGKTSEQVQYKIDLVSTPTNLLGVGWIAFLVLAIFLAGFSVGIPVFSLLYLKLHRQNWLVSILCTLGIFVMVYFGFGTLMKMDLYEGLFFQ